MVAPGKDIFDGPKKVGRPVKIWLENIEVYKIFFMKANKFFIGSIIVVIICFLIYISFALISIPFVLLFSLFT